MAGTLFVVATPIGHLEDMTLRALRVLREVAVVAAEDTRRSGHLLRHFGIGTPLMSLHAHNERARGLALLQRLQRGDDVAVISDAGTPGIADPGADLVRRARDLGLRVEAVPGASAVSTAISIAGLAQTEFAFLGFPPVRSKDRKAWFDRLRRLHPDLAQIFFEAPHRIPSSLRELANLVKQPILVFRELTKLHEEALVGMAADLAERLRAPVGEFTVVVPKLEVTENIDVVVDEEAVRLLFGQVIERTQNLSPRAAAREVGKRFGLRTRQVYELTKR